MPTDRARVHELHELILINSILPSYILCEVIPFTIYYYSTLSIPPLFHPPLFLKQSIKTISNYNTKDKLHKDKVSLKTAVSFVYYEGGYLIIY